METGTSTPSTLRGSSTCLTALPERVSELFMLEDQFFRSPFIRHKIVPGLLFSNGASGLESTFSSPSSSGSSSDNQGSPGTTTATAANMQSPMFPNTTNRHSSTNSRMTIFNDNDDQTNQVLNSSSQRRFSAGNTLDGPEKFGSSTSISMVRNIPIRVVTGEPLLSGPVTNSGSSTTINFFPARTQPTPILRNEPKLSLLSELNRRLQADDIDEADSVSLRSAPPEFWRQRSREEDGSGVSVGGRSRVVFEDEEEARRKLSAPKEFLSHSARSTSSQPSMAGHAPPLLQRRHFFWQPHRDNVQQSAQGYSAEARFKPNAEVIIEDRNGNRRENTSTPINFRSVPIVQVHQHQINRRENSFGNGVNLTDYSLSGNNNNWLQHQQQQQRSSTPSEPTRMENSKSPMDLAAATGDKPYYSAIPFRRPTPTQNLAGGLIGPSSMSSATSTPSLLSNTAPQKQGLFLTKKQQQVQGRKGLAEDVNRDVQDSHQQQQVTAPSFLRRTQTAYTIPSAHLPRRDSEPSVIIAAANDSSTHPNFLNEPTTATTNNRHSLHETSFQSPDPQPPTQPPSRSKSPSMSSLRQGISRGLSKPKKITFVPSCVRRKHGSDDEGEGEEEERNSRVDTDSSRLGRSRSPSLTASSLRLTEFVPTERDPVEEAIRSLESFDPNDYITQHKQNPANTLFHRQQQKQQSPASASSDDDSLPPPPPLPLSLTPQHQQQQYQYRQQAKDKQALTSTPSSSSGIEADVGSQKKQSVERDSALSTLSSSSATSSSPSSSYSNQSQNFQRETDSKPSSYIHHQQRPSAAVDSSSSIAGVTLRRPSTSTSHSSGSATPTGQLSGGESTFNRSFENRTPRATTPTPAVHTGSETIGMGNANGVYGKAPMAHHQQRQYGHKSPEAPFEMDQLLSRLKSPSVEPIVLPPYCSPDYDDEDSEAAAEAEAHLRKRFLCTQLTDCAKVVDINALKMSQFAAAGGGGWRQAHILRHNLAAIRDTVYTIEFALEELVDALARISLSRGDAKAAEFHQLSSPLLTSQSLIRRLRANLDATGWSLQALARQGAAPAGVNDALDQFVAILRQLPRDCYKLVQWVYLLGVWNSNGAGPAVFLSSSTHSVPPPPAPIPHTNAIPRPQLTASYHASQPNTRYSSSSSASEDSPRNSAAQPPATNFSNRAQEPAKSSQGGGLSRAQPTTSPRQKKENPLSRAQKSPLSPLQPPTVAEINMDGGESTTSSATSSVTMDDVIVQQPEVIEQQRRVGQEEIGKQPKTAATSSTRKPTRIDPNSSVEEDEPEELHSKVYEEDDLMSVASESIDSLYGDYSFVNEQPRSNPTSNTMRPQQLRTQQSDKASPSQMRRNQQQLTQKAAAAAHLELAKGLSEEERELLRFYQPQVDSNTGELCRLVDEFFTVVEEHQEAKSFVQKIQMICIKTQTLVCIARMVAKDDITAISDALNKFLAREANHLDSLLNECVGSARIAKDKFQSQSVPAVQAMVSSVSAVSQAALNLKLFWKSCV